MRRITISLFDDEREALNVLAQRERRDIRAQAAFLIRHDLRQRGLLPIEENTAISNQADRQEKQNVNHE